MGNICNVEPLQAQGTVVVDSAQSISSENPLQNKVVTIEKANASALCVDLSGNPITFNADSQAVQKLQVALEPIQDLHGYDKPWVGGAGKNKCPVEKLTASPSDYFDLAVGSYIFSFRRLGSPKYSTSKIRIRDSNNNDIVAVPFTGSQEGQYLSGTFTLTETTSCRILNENVNVDSSGYAIDNIQIESGNERTAFAPYTNICPISGRTGTGVVANGRNLFDGEWEDGSIDNATGQDTASSAHIRSKNYCACFPNTDLYMVGVTNTSIRCFFYDDNENFISSVADTNNYHVPSNAKFFRLKTSDKTANTKNVCINISDASFNGQYEPYKTPVSCSIQFGQTVYGGTVDFKTGKVIIDKGYVEYDGSSDESWNYEVASGLKNFYIQIGNAKAAQAIGSMISNQFPTSPNAYAVNQNTVWISHTKNLNAPCGDTLNISTVADFKTYLASNHLQVCYTLVTPIELQLTPSELELLKGYNYITADGNMEISIVPEDVIGYTMGQIISAMGTDESGRTTASRAYTSGEYFYKDGKMYKALTSIASGATFTVGTNCSQTTLFAELKAAQN